MSRILFFRWIWISLLLLYNSAKSQPDHFTYAVTPVNKGGTEWVTLRKLDTRTGEFSPVLFKVPDFQGTQAYAIQDLSIPGTHVSVSLNPQTPSGNSVAAIAYDRKTNRLFYTPMTIDQLRYIDLSTMESFPVPDQFFSKAGKYDFKNAGPINRMVIAPDGFGYTITADGDHLIRFTTNGTPILTDQGTLLDDPKNKEWTIHSICANSGGDMIADDAGHLILITGSNKVFKVDIATRITTYLATVSGLPQKFMTSGVAVSEDGKHLLATSVLYTDAYFLIDPETWIALPVHSTHEIFESADLANSNILFSKSSGSAPLFIPREQENGNGIRIFPNPVPNDEISIQFNNLTPGNYTIQLVSAFGNTVVQQKARITTLTQTESLSIPRAAPQGFYYIHILDEKNKVVSTQKLVVERW